MDLNETPEMAAFRGEVRGFLEAHRDDYAGGAAKDVLAWQRDLIAAGYAARTIPAAYGGYGAEPDILKSRIIAEEFIAAGAPRGETGSPAKRERRDGPERDARDGRVPRRGAGLPGGASR